MTEDAELLRRYVSEQSEPAFSELVRRHINLVYSVALRQVAGDAHLAEDVTQQVFLALARKAKSLIDCPALSGWLYRSTHFAASDAVRATRRRRTREQEAHRMTMDSSTQPTIAESQHLDWDSLRPVIDEAIAELEARDRDAVSLRFFEQCSFAEVGARLRLTENAARMRVDRALDKLHAALTRRGIRSTAGALAIALGQQAMAHPPAALAASVTGAALAGAAAVDATTTAGVFAVISSSKFVAGAAVCAAVLAGGVATVQHRRARAVETALAAAGQQQHALQADRDAAADRAAQAERRAAEAEKDNGELLKAVDALRKQQAARSTAAAAPTGGIVGMVQDATAGRSEEQVLYERTYQRELARVRAEQAKAKAHIDERAVTLDPASRYYLLMEFARELMLAGDFQASFKAFNYAMSRKPPEIPISSEVSQLQSTLQAQTVPVAVTLVSDGETWVSIENFRVPQKLFQPLTLTLPPGNYRVMGRRKGYGDVSIRLEVRSGIPPPTITVICR